MVSLQDLQKIVKWAKRSKARILFRFQEYPNLIVINSFIHAKDRREKTIQWQEAFGSKPPDQVLNSLKISEIEVLIAREGEKIKLETIDQLIQKTNEDPS